MRGAPCLICDLERYGTLEVLVTHVERDALHCIARGRSFDDRLARRLVKIGLASRLDRGGLALTPKGSALIGRAESLPS